MSISLERRIQAYPCHKYFCLFKAYADKKDIGDSEMVETMARSFFDKMTEREQQQLMDHYKSITKPKKT